MFSSPEINFHYTTVRGAIGIVNSRSVWVCDARYLNDSGELSRYLELFESRLEAKGFQVPPFFQRIVMSLFSSRFLCVFCLSKSPIILSQWISYADKARGVCLGLSVPRLYASFEEKFTSEAVRFLRCVYENHERDIDILIDRYASEVGALCDFCQRTVVREHDVEFPPEYEEVLSSIVPVFLELLRMKHPAFEEEQEVRIAVSVSSSSALFRESNRVIVPYVEGPFPEDGSSIDQIIPDVWLGPRCDSRNEEALRIVTGGNSRMERYDIGYR